MAALQASVHLRSDAPVCVSDACCWIFICGRIDCSQQDSLPNLLRVVSSPLCYHLQCFLYSGLSRQGLTERTGCLAELRL